MRLFASELSLILRCVYNNGTNKRNSFWFLIYFVYSYKNGSFAREKIRESCAKGQWEEFGRLLDSTQPGNDGNIGKVYKFRASTIIICVGA